MRPSDLPIMSVSEQEEMSTLTTFLRHEAIDRHGYSEEGKHDDEGMLRLAELIDLALTDITTWREFIQSTTTPRKEV